MRKGIHSIKILLVLFSLCSLSTGSVFIKNSIVKKNSTEFRLLSLARNSLDIEHTLLCLQQHFRCWSRKNLDFLSFLPKSSLFGHLFSQCSNSAVWLLFRNASLSSAAAVFSPNCLPIKRRRRKEQADRMCLFKWRVFDGQLAVLFIVLACVIPPPLQFSAILNCSELNWAHFECCQHSFTMIRFNSILHFLFTTTCELSEAL